MRLLCYYVDGTPRTIDVETWYEEEIGEDDEVGENEVAAASGRAAARRTIYVLRNENAYITVDPGGAGTATLHVATANGRTATPVHLFARCAAATA